jgi:hypothetical protein
VSIDVDPYGLQDPAHVVRYVFDGLELTSVTRIECWSENIQGDRSSRAVHDAAARARVQ